MKQEQSGFAPDRRVDNDNRKIQQRDLTATSPIQPSKPESWRQRWNKVQPTKMFVFWVCVASILLTMLIGFNWGGWMRGSAAQQMATAQVNNALTERLATICVAQFNLDSVKGQKLQELYETASYQRGEYITTQGWATMPGEEKPTSRVAEACARQLMLIIPR